MDVTISRWAIVEGATGRLCIVPERMVESHLTYGRKTCIWILCSGLLEAVNKLNALLREGLTIR